MDITTIASIASANASTSLKAQASVLVLKKAMEMQQANAAHMLQALTPPAPPVPGAKLGSRIDTFA